MFAPRVPGRGKDNPRNPRRLSDMLLVKETSRMAFTDLGGAGRLARTTTGVAVGALATTAVTLVITALTPSLDPWSLTGLYLFAVVPVAIGWGFGPAAVAAVASYLAFEYFFVPPVHSFAIARAEAIAQLLIALATAYVISELARRAQTRANEAQMRVRETAEAHAIQRRLLREQAALRRVATLVAEGVSTGELFEAVAREVGLLCDADLARMERFDAGRAVTAIAAWARNDRAQLAVGTRFALEGASIAAQVRDTGRPARVDSFAGARGPIAAEAQRLGIRASVGCPITVEGRLWGVIAASTTHDQPFPPDTEARIGDFTELVATAIANAEARAELVASRQRLLTAGDEARRRVVRDLHDGAQQRFVHTIMTLELALRSIGEEPAGAGELIAEALEHAKGANRELRELAHGLLPDALTRGGLAAGVDSIVAALRVPVDVSVPEQRFPPEIEASAYFVIAEALTNVAKHAGAQRAEIAARVDDGSLRIDVRDDGVGGARPDGTGLLGLRDRVVTLGGWLELDSPRGGGTRLAITLPLRR
ncbi:sensor histidine kinase [Solirubrobacter ginsenosidimutans]